MLSKEKIFKSLSHIIDPKQKKSIVECGYIESVTIDSDLISITLQLPEILEEHEAQFTSLVKTTLESDFSMKVVISVNYIMPDSQLDHVKSIIAVSSCKGGVGKSSVSVNLAYSLAKQGFKVGIFDADVYGPSLPTMVKHPSPELEVTGTLIKPIEVSGVKLMSFGYTLINGEQSAAVLRGPMVSQIIHQLLLNTMWGELDYLILDFPPGTGDIQLTIGQLVSVDASVIVTTPQYVSFIDVVKGIEMFDKLKIPTLSVVENMSYFKCSSCDEKHMIFGQGNLKTLKENFGFKHAYGIPIEPEFAAACDSGVPYVLQHEDSEITELFSKIASELNIAVRRLKREGYHLPRVDYDQEKGILIIPHNESPYYILPRTLRQNCGCAKCVDEFTGKLLLDTSKIDKDLVPLSMNPVGNYALGINWSDGHSSLYPYEKINQLAYAPH